MCKKTWKMAICLAVLMTVLAGCGGTENAQEDESADINASVTGVAYTVHYVDTDFQNTVTENVYFDQMETTENILDSLMTYLINGSDDGAAAAPMPEGIYYQRYIYDGESTVTIFCGADYETADEYQVLISKMAIVKTLCQVDGITDVTFQYTNLISEEAVDITTYNLESFATVEESLE